jgi:glutamate-1-semialdehyde 2,1-aminomutase
MYGMTRAVAEAVSGYTGRAMGSTLSGGAFSTHVMKAMLREVITEKSYALMKAAAIRYGEAVSRTIKRHDLPWHVTSLGARVAFGFDKAPPRSGASSLTEEQALVGRLIHRTLWFFLANRGVLFGGWDCTSLFCPLIEDSDVTLHIELIEEAVAQIAAR